MLSPTEPRSLLSHSPTTYKIPNIQDIPDVFNVAVIDNDKNAGLNLNVRGSKAVGEPPLMLALSAREAIRDAISAFGSATGEIALSSPATGEAIWRSIQNRTRGAKTSD